MKKYVLSICFLAIMLITNLVSASSVYKNKEYSIDFIIPVSDKVEDYIVSWHFLSLNKKNQGCKLSTSDIKKYQKKIKDKNYSFGLFRVNASNEVDSEIYVEIFDNCPTTYAQLSAKSISIISKSFQDLISEDYKGFTKRHIHCSEESNPGTMGRDFSNAFILSNGEASLIHTLTRRMGREVRILGYGKDLNSFQEVRGIVSKLVLRMDFDATYPEGYFTVKLENL